MDPRFTLYSDEEVLEICREMAEDLKVDHPDLMVSEDGRSAKIPYYGHGRMEAHQIDLEMMAKTALIIARRPRYSTTPG